MNNSEVIVEFFKNKGINDFFGYQGTMIAYFVDAISRCQEVQNHSCYNEQGASFAGCGYAQATDGCAVVYSTSGPGAMNLISGIANAYYDSIPVFYITGQINTYEYAGIKGKRQQGFQECDIVSMVRTVTKKAVQLTKEDDIQDVLDDLWVTANSGRKGPVLLDIPMNLQRTDYVNKNIRKGSTSNDLIDKNTVSDASKTIIDALNASKRPVLLIGNGLSSCAVDLLYEIANNNRIPIVASLLAYGKFYEDNEHGFGYLGGAYGKRIANLLVAAKADLLLCFGISLCSRQVGFKRDSKPIKVKVIRMDIDQFELERSVSEDEIHFCIDAGAVVEDLSKRDIPVFEEWHSVADMCRDYLDDFDLQDVERYPNRLLKSVTDYLGDNVTYVGDVGQNMMWLAQSITKKKGQRLFFSGGHGAMGYALPAAIGVSIADRHRKVVCVAGDGGFQMNIQELQWVAREQLPIKILVMNNNALGMIRFLQSDYFQDRYEGTTDYENSYIPCNFAKVAEAYGIPSKKYMYDDYTGIKKELDLEGPMLIEIVLPNDTASLPKTFLGREVYDQRTYIPREKLDWLLKL
ncbi:thiamine pyrophosphate-binding protein [Butyrivibrio sp. INlla14]|uniref:thiamine pyrophosphate-binding protein n=1 Tax=Butyrivibrio sp. INlla14 TaxID=1520808 RepID=UPI0008769E57|nr:thiamine pyrophosphate-binding protein [Butyrivibrio sp. INlla14]SCY74455.1 acetolactate synthase-1/2/3 large subunit [Butyrivibrio sp. INlla14]